jgi:mono/diheme cytochrome c family protein
MMRRTVLNAFLFVVMVALLAANGGLRSETGRRNFELFPNMARSAASESYAANALFADGMAMRKPVPGTVVRGFVPIGYGPGKDEAIRAGEELANPVTADAAALTRGAAIYATYCQVCHGPGGLGDGTVSKRGFPTPPSLLAENALALPDGRIFHIVTHGQNNMPPYAAQIARRDRWKAVLHVRSMQSKGAAGSQFPALGFQGPPAPASIAASSGPQIGPAQPPPVAAAN